jgi:hypothetical protein
MLVVKDMGIALVMLAVAVVTELVIPVAQVAAV